MRPINIYLLSRSAVFDAETFERADRVLSANDSVIREHEKNDLKALADCLTAAGCALPLFDGFYYSYTVPQIGKEFDLLKFADGATLNIEIKHERVADDEIVAQLEKNRYYLAHLGGRVTSLCYIALENEWKEYDGATLSAVAAERAAELVGEFADCVHVIIDELFKPSEFLVSPLTEPQRFLNGEYFLTNHQNDIKKSIMRAARARSQRYFSIKGGAGTGKTLLLYDLAHELTALGKVCVVHCGILCGGHAEIMRNSAINVIAVKELVVRDLNEYDFVLIDESHRLQSEQLDWIIEESKVAIFSLDRNQMLSSSEFKVDIAVAIDKIQGLVRFELTNKIRTNRELATFIIRLFDLSKRDPNVKYENVDVIYAGDKLDAQRAISHYRDKGYEFINFTPSKYNRDILDSFEPYSDSNTHRVIGQEFDRVVMFMDRNFRYDGNKLCANEHPNPDYIYTQLLYQGLTRVREKLCIVVFDNPDVYKNLLRIADNRD